MEFRDYQNEAVELALPHAGFALFLEQRTGKSPVAVRIAQRRQPKRLLITCPTVAFGVWRTELRDAGGIPGCVTRIVTHESLWGQRKRLKRWQPDGVIGDEIHRFKNPTKSKRSKALRLIGKYAQWRLGLSGTPIGQGIQDGWALFDFIAPEVFGLWSEFKARYLKYGGYMGKKIIGTKNVEEFREKIGALSYRKLLEDVQPVKTRKAKNVVKFDLVESRPAYDSMAEKFMTQLNSGQRVVAPRVITQVLKLHQLAGGFIIDEDRRAHHVGDEKLTQAGLILRRATGPMVFIVRFLPELRRLKALCEAMGASVTRISGGYAFTGFSTDVAIVQIQSGVAIDLSRAAELTVYSMDYSYFNFDQAMFRILAYSSVAVKYNFLLAKGTMDEDIYAAVSTKQSVAKYVIDKYRRK